MVTAFSLFLCYSLFDRLLLQSPPPSFFQTRNSWSHSVALINSVTFFEYFLFLIYASWKDSTTNKDNIQFGEVTQWHDDFCCVLCPLLIIDV